LEDSKFHGRCRSTVLGEKATGEDMMVTSRGFGEVEEAGLHGVPPIHSVKAKRPW